VIIRALRFSDWDPTARDLNHIPIRIEDEQLSDVGALRIKAAVEHLLANQHTLHEGSIVGYEGNVIHRRERCGEVFLAILQNLQTLSSTISHNQMNTGTELVRRYEMG
jgi:hypothetical protein